jgi:glutathione peroxidase-family protein
MSILSTARMYLRRTPKIQQPTDLYTHRVTLLDGGELDLASLRGRPTLIVNTASKCGYTPQYEGLQKLHERYAERGLQVLGSPSSPTRSTTMPTRSARSARRTTGSRSR